MTTYLRHLILIAAFFAAFQLVAGDNTTTAYNFLDVPVSSHVYALGGHNLTVIDDENRRFARTVIFAADLPFQESLGRLEIALDIKNGTQDDPYDQEKDDQDRYQYGLIFLLHRRLKPPGSVPALPRLRRDRYYLDHHK